MNSPQDSYGRKPRKLRVSVTDRCNFRCGYCMPSNPQWADPAHQLDFDERLRLIRLFVNNAGIDAIRLTGGEPLLKPEIIALIHSLKSSPDTRHVRISLTTNGQLLGRRLEELMEAGLDDANVSLDSLNTERFDALTRTKGRLPSVLQSIEKAKNAGLPVKINTVVINSRNHEDIIPLLDWANEKEVLLRFIEFMPLDGGEWWKTSQVFSEAQIISAIHKEKGEPTPVNMPGPATYYQLPSGQTFGVIPTITNPFCGECDRMRLTAEGSLYTCLFSSTGRDLKTPMRRGASDDELFDSIRDAIHKKPAGYIESGQVERPITMHTLGG